MEQAAANGTEDISVDEWGPNDLFAQVMGEDKGSYVRGIGLGPSAKDLWGSKDTRLMLRKKISYTEKYCESQLNDVKEKIDKMNDRLDAIMNLLAAKFTDIHLGADKFPHTKV